MLDGGSQRSYITQRVKDVLGLESERAEEVHIQTFGSENTRTQTVEMVTATYNSSQGRGFYSGFILSHLTHLRTFIMPTNCLH